MGERCSIKFAVCDKENMIREDCFNKKKNKIIQCKRCDYRNSILERKMAKRIQIKEEEMVKEVPHNGCGGKYQLITEKPVKAGSNPGSVYYVYICNRCGEIKIIGGK